MQNKRLTGDAMCCEMMDCPSAPPGGSYCDTGTCYPRELYERLRYYEDLEEAGRYIVLAEPERAGVDRLQTLAQADVEGRVMILPEAPPIPDNISNPLEPLKIAAALKSELLKISLRKKIAPQNISPLDYTVIAALQQALDGQGGRK